MSDDQSLVIGSVMEDPRVVLANGRHCVQTTLDCGRGRRVTVEGPVAVVATEAGSVTAGVGAQLFRFTGGRAIAVRGEVAFGPVRVVVHQVTPRTDARSARPVVLLPFGPFRVTGYRRQSGQSLRPEAELELLDGQRLRAIFPEHVFASPGSFLCARLAWSSKHGFRSPLRLTEVSPWRADLGQAA